MYGKKRLWLRLLASLGTGCLGLTVYAGAGDDQVFRTASAGVPLWVTNETGWVVAAVMAVLAVSAGTGCLLLCLKGNRRLKMILEAMPIHVGITDRSGKIYFFRARLPDGAGPLRSLQDLPETILKIFEEPIRQVLEDGRSRRVEYVYQGRWRRAEFVRLPKKGYGVATVLGISFDVDELHTLTEQFRLMLKSIGDGIVAVDAQGHIMLVNQVAARLIGLPREELVGKSFDESVRLMGAADGNGAEAPSRRPIGLAQTIELREPVTLAAPNGECHVAVTAAPIRDEAGKGAGAILVFRDITANVEKERKLNEANQLLQAIQDNLPCAFFVKNADDDFRYLMCNRSYAAFLGTDSAGIIGRTDAELYDDPANVEACRRSDLIALERGEGDNNETVTGKDGGKYIFRCIKSSLTRSDGTRLLLGLCIDITQQERLEKEREKLLENLKSYVEQEKLLNRIWARLMTKLDDQEVFTEILRTIVGFMGAYTGYIYRSDFSIGKDIAYAAFEEDASLEIPLEDYPEMPIVPEAVWFQKTMNHEIWEVTDTETEEARRIQGEWNRHMPALGVRALCGIGLWLNGKYWGYIGFAFRAPHEPLSAQQKFLLISMAHIAEIFLERKRSRQDLDRSEYEKHLILDTMNIPIMLFNPDMQLIRCNNAALAIAGKSEEEVYRLGCQEVFCGEKCRSRDCPVRRTHDDLMVHTRELHLKDRDYLLRANPIVIDGKLVYIMKTMLDVTEFNAIQKKLTTALQEAQAASKAKSYFLATMSHEIRTPLNAVIGFSELLKGGDLSPEEQMEYLDSINLAGNSLLRLINDVLDLSKLESEQMVLMLQPTDLSALFREIQAVFQYKVQEKKLFFRMDCPNGLPLLKVDNLRLRQILLNLIGNAVKFSEQGGITLAADFRPGRDAARGTLFIQVRDTGIGIAEEARHRIFKPFVQSDTIRDTHVYGGTGLGLAICHRLAERMNGKIMLESEVGKGSCFIVRLDEVEPVTDSGERPAAACAEAPTDLQKLRLLLVDDVPMNLKVLAAMLRKLDVESVCAGSGGEALNILQDDRNFEVVLTDLWMPGMNGVELAKKIRQNPLTARLPVIAVTADAESRDNFAIEHFAGLLLKPVTLEKLNEILDKFHKKATEAVPGA